ncbi:hypothetical protein [Sporosarcina sp. NPDC096371]|uniref:hypothetical protein n=1 Tax=Sporosarcina sp. NPDC096371 TaxID=3364530 RepID=UPI0038275786
MQDQKFKKLLDDLKGLKIGLFLSDNQFIEGVLLDVKQDHLVVDVNQNVFYFALPHIQTLSKNAKDFHVSSKVGPYLDRNYLVDVLIALRSNWIIINNLSDQKISGVLSGIFEDHIELINNTEILYISKSNISNIYSKISGKQMILLNNAEQLDIQQSYQTNINKEIYEMNEQPAGISQDFVSHPNDETKEQSDSLQEEELHDSQYEEQVVFKQLQITNNNESEKNSKAPLTEKHAEEVIEDGNVSTEYTEAVIIGEPNSLQWDKFDVLNRDEDDVRNADISEEKEIQEFVSQVKAESTEQFNSPGVEEIQDRNVSTEYLKTEIVSEPNSLQWDTFDVLKQHEDNVRNADISQEKEIQEFVSQVKVESTEQSNSPGVEEIQDRNVSTEYLKTEIISEQNSLQWDTFDVLKQDEDNVRNADISQDKEIQEFVSQVKVELTDQSDSSREEELQDSQHEQRLAVNPIQTIDNNETKKSSKSLDIGNSVGEVTGVANVKNEHPSTHLKMESKVRSNLLVLEKYESMNSDEDDSFEENLPDVLESTKNVSKEDQFIPTEPQFRHNEKKILLTAWSTSDNVQRAIISQTNFGEDSKFPAEEDNVIKKEYYSEPTEINSTHLPVRKIGPEEEQVMLQMQYYALKIQYYALMIHAAGNSIKMDYGSEHIESSIHPACDNDKIDGLDASDESEHIQMPISQISLEDQEMVEEQYYSLMKHAEKMYLQLRDLGL